MGGKGKERLGNREGRKGRREGRKWVGRTQLGYLSSRPELLVKPLIVNTVIGPKDRIAA